MFHGEGGCNEAGCYHEFLDDAAGDGGGVGVRDEETAGGEAFVEVGGGGRGVGCREGRGVVELDVETGLVPGHYAGIAETLVGETLTDHVEEFEIFQRSGGS